MSKNVIIFNKPPETKKEDLYKIKSTFKPSELAVKALGTLQEDGNVKDLQILSVDIVNESSN